MKLENIKMEKPKMIYSNATLPRIAGALEELYARRLSTDADLADLTVAVAFEYIDFRLPEIQWRCQAPHLAERVRSLGQRTSLETTRPPRNS